MGTKEEQERVAQAKAKKIAMTMKKRHKNKFIGFIVNKTPVENTAIVAKKMKGVKYD